LPVEHGTVRCLGVDPGIGRLGFGLVQETGNSLRPIDYGCIETLPGEALEKRLFSIYNSLQEAIDRLKPDIISVERLFFRQEYDNGGSRLAS